MDQNDLTASMRVLHNHGWCGMKSIVALFWCFVKHVDKVDVISYMTEERMGHKVSPIVVVHWSLYSGTFVVESQGTMSVGQLHKEQNPVVRLVKFTSDTECHWLVLCFTEANLICIRSRVRFSLYGANMAVVVTCVERATCCIVLSQWTCCRSGHTVSMDVPSRWT